MADFKPKTAIEIAMYAVLEGVEIKDDDNNVKVIKDLQINFVIKCIYFSFTDGSKGQALLTDKLMFKGESLTFTAVHTEPKESIKPNTKILKNKNRNE